MTAYGSKRIITTLALLASLISAGSVFAHAHLKGETPAADSTVSAPDELRLVFSEGVEAQFTQVKISTGSKDEVIKSIANAAGDQKTLIVTPQQPLAPGEYKVE